MSETVLLVCNLLHEMSVLQYLVHTKQGLRRSSRHFPSLLTPNKGLLVDVYCSR